MRFMHLGDLHLGRSLGDFDLRLDQDYILNFLIKMAEEQSVDAVLIAGDVYDKPSPSEAAIRMLDHFLNELEKRRISTFVISGNHDSDERLNYGSAMFESHNIFISSKYEGVLYKKTFKVGDEEADIYLMPFVKASHVRYYHPEDKIDSYDDAVRAILKHANIDPSRCNIIVAHQFVIGRTENPELGGSESLGTQSVGTVEKIGYDCFDDFDYVALGHIHSPQQIGRKEVRYAGSPLKYSLSEVDNCKTVPIITVSGKGKVDVDLISIKPKREMRHIKGKLKELLDRTNIVSPDDYIYATLTDEDYINDAMGFFQREYPNTVKIDYDNSHTREIEQVNISRIAENRSYADLVSDFYRQIFGCEISDEEMTMMRDVAREAGVLHEAD